MIIYDMEVFKYDWILSYLDCDKRQMYNIVNDKEKLQEFYETYKSQIWVGYNSRNYDVWIVKAILCDFNPYEMNDWIINREQKGFMFSKLLNKFPIINYDCSVGFRSLKELEAFMGHDIQETSVPFDIDRKLTDDEITQTIGYCNHDVMETFNVFIETSNEFNSHMGLINEFGLTVDAVNKTKAQISAIILGASKVNRTDEFNIRFPETLVLGKYGWIGDWYKKWAKNEKTYETMSLTTNICGVPHTFGIGGLHGAVDKYMGTGMYLMADVASYYPALMIEYNYLSRNVTNPKKYKDIRDDRILLKKNKDPREYPRKIVLNSTFGASKDKYNNLYDPLQANNICIAGQLLLLDLLEKLEGTCELIQSNTDGILIKVYSNEDIEIVKVICSKWSNRTRMILEFEEVKMVIQKDVNNYVIVNENGKVKRKGSFVKELSNLDNDLPIVNKAIVDYLLYSIPVETTVNNSTKLIDFQKITKITGKYEYGFHKTILNEKVHRCFASTDMSDPILYKKHRGKTTLDKTAGTPEHCFIINSDITEMSIPDKLDKQWYINLAKERIKTFF